MNQNSDIDKLKNLITTKCPKCNGEIVLAIGVEKGEIVSCDECGAELEVVTLDPLLFNDAPLTQEDWGE